VIKNRKGTNTNVRS